jgi:SAM-dependent methyltransferase
MHGRRRFAKPSCWDVSKVMINPSYAFRGMFFPAVSPPQSRQVDEAGPQDQASIIYRMNLFGTAQMQSKSHWEHIYSTRSETEVSWFQPHATLSTDLIHRICAIPTAAIIDVGGGASTLVDDLLAHGYENLSVLDLSGEALAVARRRLGPRAGLVRWIEGDVTSLSLPEGTFDVWHDRAVFHFLTDEADRHAYVAQVMRAVKPGGHVIVATFAPDGPAECSGLPVIQYDANSLHAEFGPAFELVEHDEEQHITPAGRVQHFVYCHCLKSH